MTLTGVHVHAGGTSCHPATLLQALVLALAGVLGLALHVVIVVGLAPRPDKERGGEEGRGSSTELLYLRDRIGERGGVVEDLLVEAVARWWRWW